MCSTADSTEDSTVGLTTSSTVDLTAAAATHSTAVVTALARDLQEKRSDLLHCWASQMRAADAEDESDRRKLQERFGIPDLGDQMTELKPVGNPLKTGDPLW